MHHHLHSGNGSHAKAVHVQSATTCCITSTTGHSLHNRSHPKALHVQSSTARCEGRDIIDRLSHQLQADLSPRPAPPHLVLAGHDQPTLALQAFVPSCSTGSGSNTAWASSKQVCANNHSAPAAAAAAAHASGRVSSLHTSLGMGGLPRELLGNHTAMAAAAAAAAPAPATVR